MSTSARPDSRLTYDDFLLFPDDGLRHELIGGEHYVTPSPNLRHQKLSGRLYLAVAEYLRAHPGVGDVYYAPLDVKLSNWDIVEPDLLLVTADQREILTENRIVGAPALVVEILSPGTRSRDQRHKRQLFEQSGVREYWMVDPDQHTVTVDRLGAAGIFDRIGVFGPEDSLTSPLLPGLSIPLNVLFAE